MFVYTVHIDHPSGSVTRKVFKREEDAREFSRDFPNIGDTISLRRDWLID